MIRNRTKCFRILFVIAILVPQLYAHYVLGTAKNIEKSPTNQLTIQQQQLIQHKPIQSEEETYVSHVSVRDEEPLKQHHESYDKNNDVVADDNDDNNDNVYVDNDGNDDMFDEEDIDPFEIVNDDEKEAIKNEGLNTLSRKRRELSDWLIAPNTRWCGRGNTADGKYNHLGGASAADKCCRRHDHCKMFIPSMSNRYELFNYRPYTLSHCSCDRRFRTCLKMANDEDAKTIGKLFFNMVQSQCFVLRTEKVCQQRAADGTCQNEFVKHKAYIRENKKF